MWFKRDKTKHKKPKNFGKRWTKEEENILLKALLDDASLKSISEVLGREPSAVNRKYASIEKKRKSGSWNAQETLQLIQLWNSESSMETIGQQLDRKRNSILGRLNFLPGYPNEIDEELFREQNKKKLDEYKPRAQYNLAKGVVEEVITYAFKGYEVEHIAEQLGIDIDSVAEIMDEEGIWEKYDSIMLNKAEKRYNKPPKLGNEKSSIDLLIKTREEERQKAVLYINRLRQNPEGSNIEFKETFERNTFSKARDIDLIHSVLKNVCGFLNTRGGDLVLGINDKSREVVGLEFDYYKDDEEYVRRISLAIENNFKNKAAIYLCNVSMVEIDKKKVCWIHVDLGEEPSFLVHQDWNVKQKSDSLEEHYYKRVNDSAISLNLTDTIRDIIKNFPDSRYVSELKDS